MRDTTANVGMKSENSTAATKSSGPQFDIPKIEFPTNLRELAKDAMAQTKGNYERIETAANEMISVLASTQSTAAKSVVNYRAWLMNVAHGNVIATFDFAQNLATQNRCQTSSRFRARTLVPDSSLWPRRPRS